VWPIQNLSPSPCKERGIKGVRLLSKFQRGLEGTKSSLSRR
jgi:hypothetical protein